jgi:GNAT superfamily N-acetyltransferase
MAHIRPFQESDRDATAHIVSQLSSPFFPTPSQTGPVADRFAQCRATLPPSLARSDAATRLAPYLWTHQFTLLSPSTCLVLDDGSGVAVGYIVGCPSIPAFVESYPAYISQILDPSEEISKPEHLTAKAPWFIPGTEDDVNPECLAQQAYNPNWLLLDGRDKLLEWKAMLHIDLLEPFQGKGWGRKLIDGFVERVRQEGGYGQGVHLVAGGENEKVVGFYEKVGFRVLPGGEKEGTIWMVRDLE